MEAEIVSHCPVCGDPIDYCHGHADSIGAAALAEIERWEDENGQGDPRRSAEYWAAN